MNKTLTKELLVAIGMIIIAGFCMFSAMKPMMYLSTHIIAIVLFLLFAFIIWRSKVTDEREAHHKATSADIGFTTGGIMLGIGMIYQIYTMGKIDVWLMATLSIMIVARVIAQLWLNKNR